MFCAISGQVPNEPVYVAKTGLVYESRILQKALESDHNKCPVTGMTIDFASEASPIKTTGVVLPRPPSSNSFPSMLDTLQSEWDSLLLEQISLRKELAETRKDLATAMYEREAASSIIARLLEENENLKRKLETGVTPTEDVESSKKQKSTEEAPALSEAISEQLKKEASILLGKRRSYFKTAPMPGNDGVVSVETMKQWKTATTLKPHATTKSAVTCLTMGMRDIRNADQTFRYVVTGGADGCAKVIDSEKGQIEATIKPKHGAITDVSMCGVFLSVGCHDKTTSIFSVDSWDKICEFSCFSKAVSSSPMHPTCPLVGMTCEDGSWALGNISTGQVEVQVGDISDAINTSQFHPDGNLYAIARGDKIDVYDINASPSKGPVADSLVHDAISMLSFSQNGFLLASAGGDGCVKIWDLRKLTSLASIQCTSFGKAECRVTSVSFDPSGNFLGIGDSMGGVRIVAKPELVKGGDGKPWDIVVEFSSHKKAITGMAFQMGAREMWLCCADRSVEQYCG